MYPRAPFGSMLFMIIAQFGSSVTVVFVKRRLSVFFTPGTKLHPQRLTQIMQDDSKRIIFFIIKLLEMVGGVMKYQSVFKRFELKYLLTDQQKARMIKEMAPYMQLDQYGLTTIRNLYFDTDHYLLVRRSIEKPIYKEKLRVRSYCTVDSEQSVFVELKKKCEKIDFKRRITMAEHEAMAWLCNRECFRPNTQIAAEIDYFLDFYKTLQPRVFLSYEREAYYSRDGGDLRVTFDKNILARQHDLSLCSEPSGIELLECGRHLMEIKCSSSIPLWLVHFLSEEKIYKISFSKYGMAYQKMIYPKLKGDFCCV